MPDGVVAYGLLIALAIALLVAAFTDLRHRRIGNGLNLAIALAAPAYWWASGLGLSGIVWQLGIAAVVFAVSLALFARGSMGGGDVKLLVALALWLPPVNYAQLIFMMAVIGGAMSIFAGARNLRIAPDERAPRLLAAAATALWLLGSVYVVRVMNGAAPFDAAAAARAIAPAWLGAALVYGALAAGFVVLVAGARTIARRQRGRLKIPYGLAISVAGLWVLASEFLPGFTSAAATQVVG